MNKTKKGKTLFHKFAWKTHSSCFHFHATLGLFWPKSAPLPTTPYHFSIQFSPKMAQRWLITAQLCDKNTHLLEHFITNLSHFITNLYHYDTNLCHFIPSLGSLLNNLWHFFEQNGQLLHNFVRKHPTARWFWHKFVPLWYKLAPLWRKFVS